jgi:penicillin-binding protein 1C
MVMFSRMTRFMGEQGRRLSAWPARLLPFLRRHPKKLSATGVLGLALILVPLLWLRSLDKNVALVSPPPTLLIEDVQGRFIAELDPDDRKKGYWPLPEHLPQRIVAATLAAEDARFYIHAGVDWRSASRAFLQNLRHFRKVSGASTIAMQVARLQNPGGRTYSRKLTEALVARSLTKKYGHEAILRHYLKIAPYGNQYHGVVYAARRYFNKPLDDLTWAESALLAGLPRLPGRMNLLQWKGRKKADRRAIHILGRLRALKQITETEYAEARDLLPKLRISTHETRPKSCLHAALAMEKALKSPADARIQSERYLLRSTLDLDLQEEIQYQAWKAMQKFRPLGAGNVAVLVAEKSTGRILAYLGSEDYFDEEQAGAIDYAQTPRSSGSTLKPFIYAQGMTERNFTAATLLTDLGMALNGPGGGYVIRNYDEAFLGPILYRNALANSRNVPAVQVLEAVGVERSYHHLCELGLAKGEHEPRYYGVGLAIGGLYVTLKDLVRAYGVLANDGKAFQLRWFD